jgi:hypothetical protein
MTTVGIKLTADAGEFISTLGRANESVRAIEKEIEKLEKDGGNPTKLGELYYARSRLLNSSSGMERDMKRMQQNPLYQQAITKQYSGQELAAKETQLIESFHRLTDVQKKNTDAILESVKTGNHQDIVKYASEVSNTGREFSKLAETTDTAPAGKQNIAGAMHAIGFNQIAGAFNDALSRIVNSLDRSAIVNQYGAGDIMGARISEMRRKADRWGGLMQTGLTIGGGAAGFILSGGNPAGAVAGASGGNAAGQAINTLWHAPADQAATDAAYAGLWQQRSGQAMELAAITGSANDVREAFKTAADGAARFGYSAEEGMDAMKQAMRQGLSGEEAGAVMEQSFDLERRTGADRGTLLGISSMSARYGAGDALGTGWQGLQASGMKPGQYNEYLRAMQRVMEDGIREGFSKSAKEIAGDLTFIKEMSGGSELWKGEQGQQRLSQMSAGLEAATGLASSSDILAFRGAQNVLKGMDEENWRKLTDLDNNGTSDIKRSGSYIDAMILMERGLNADTFSEIMKLNNKAEGGDRSAVVERMRQQFGLNYTNSAMLYDQWAKQTDYGTKAMSSEDSQALVDTYGKVPPPANSPELDVAKKIEEIRNWKTQVGIFKWDENFPNIILKELRKAKQEYAEAKGSRSAAGVSSQRVNELMSGWGDMPVYNTPSGVPTSSFNKRMEEARLASGDTPLYQAYTGIRKHFAGLTASEQNNAAKSGYYSSIWHESQGDLVKMWESIQRNINTKPVDMDTAIQGFFDKRGDEGLLKAITSFAHVGNNDSAAKDRLYDLRMNTSVDSPDYEYLMRSFRQLSAFNDSQRETVDRDNSLNTILRDNQLTAQKLYDAVVELSRKMGVNVVFEDSP